MDDSPESTERKRKRDDDDVREILFNSRRSSPDVVRKRGLFGMTAGALLVWLDQILLHSRHSFYMWVGGLFIVVGVLQQLFPSAGFLAQESLLERERRLRREREEGER